MNEAKPGRAQAVRHAPSHVYFEIPLSGRYHIWGVRTAKSHTEAACKLGMLSEAFMRTHGIAAEDRKISLLYCDHASHLWRLNISNWEWEKVHYDPEVITRGAWRHYLEH